ncbi:hypothetical protein BO70DRAFT_420030 [Aspergillus heteromorphus CBS 117.55]|uniref:3-hydroxyisobutyrate dehydrogenase n=1 Tax=Aspergillus heteromorphus CBS 117.55 TaxID=1448321 RepID=A0A317WQH6_9EURO|nr:uncharacterized protein BO70DRAFT_420030 [Aspergillus heteromorphus CBS 117.55]PWY88315.1 hypothetical protein BO70DRAFT_420030 [Aspergillus heteromorphus CBS 117.55]
MASADFSKIGFVGLGAMGKPMVERLVAKLPHDAKIHVYDAICTPMEDLGAKYPDKVILCDSPKDVTVASNFIITMVPEGKHIRAVYFDEIGIIRAGDLSNKIFIDCSTIDLETSALVQYYVTQSHPTALFYDAPVSGGAQSAEQGTVAFYIGCPENDPRLGLITELLSLMGSSVTPCGMPQGGLTAKICNNYLSGLIAIGSSEALNMGIRAGLDPRVLSRVFAAGAAQNAVCDRFNPCPGVVPDAPSSKDYEGGFKVQLMKKDFALAVDLAESVDAALAVGYQALEVYQAAARDPDCMDRDSRVVFRFLGGDERWAERFPKDEA